MATVQNLFAQTTENKGEKKRRDQKNEAKESECFLLHKVRDTPMSSFIKPTLEAAKYRLRTCIHKQSQKLCNTIRENKTLKIKYKLL